MEQIFVGIDVAKERLDVHVRPAGESFAVARDSAGVAALVGRLEALAPSLVVMEATGGFEVTVAAALAAAGLPLAVVNPRQIRDFARASGQLAKSMAEIERMVANLDGVVNANRDDLDRSLKDAQHTLGTIAQNIDTLVHNLDGAARNMNEFSRLIRQNPGLLLNGTPREEVFAPSGFEAGAVQ